LQDVRGKTLFLTQSISSDSKYLPFLSSSFCTPNIEIVKKKKNKELRMMFQRLWNEERLKRKFSSKIKERQNKAHSLETHNISQKVLKYRDHISHVEETLQKKRMQEEISVDQKVQAFRTTLFKDKSYSFSQKSLPCHKDRPHHLSKLKSLKFEEEATMNMLNTINNACKPIMPVTTSSQRCAEHINHKVNTVLAKNNHADYVHDLMAQKTYQESIERRSQYHAKELKKYKCIVIK
jgi:hypothetical protein